MTNKRVESSLSMDGRLKGKEAELFLAWIRQSIHGLADSGVSVALDTQKKQSVLIVSAPDDDTLAQAMTLVMAALRSN